MAVSKNPPKAYFVVRSGAFFYLMGHLPPDTDVCLGGLSEFAVENLKSVGKLKE